MRSQHKWKARPLKDPTGNLHERGWIKKKKIQCLPAAFGCSVQCLSFNWSYLCSPLLWERTEDLQFILVAIHSSCNSYHSKLIQSFGFPGSCQHLQCCWNITERNCLCPRQYESAGFWWQACIDFVCATSVFPEWETSIQVLDTPIKYVAPSKPSLGYAFQFLII